MDTALPPEVIQEILPYICDGKPATELSPKDLRIAFTCRSFYRELAPLVAACQIKLITGEMVEWRLKFKDARGVLLGYDRIDVWESDLAEVHFQAQPFRHADSIWSLHSFLSRRNIAGRLTRFRLIITTYESYWERPKVAEQSKEEWQRALLRLLLLITSQVDLELELSLLESWTWYSSFLPPNSTFETFSTVFQDGTETNFCLSSLTLTGSIYALSINSLSRALIHFVIPRSYNSLARLHLNYPTATSTDWDCLLPLLKFNNLSHLSIGDLTMDPPHLVAILDQNQTIKSMDISPEPTRFVPAPPWAPARLVQGQRLPPLPASQKVCLSGIRDLTCHPRILLVLFRSGFSFPSLEKLVVCGYDPVGGMYCHISDVTTILAYLGSDEKPESSKPLNLKIDLPWDSSLKTWFASASFSAKGYIAATSISKAMKDLIGSPKSIPSSQTRDPATMPLAVALRRLHTVTSLTLAAHFTGTWEPLPSQALRRDWPLDVPPESVARFIAGMPAVKEVTLRSIFHDLRVGEGDKGLREIRKEMGKLWKMSTTMERVSIYDYGHGELSQRLEVLIRP